MGALTLASKPTYVATATVIAKNPENATDRPLSFPEVVTSNTVALRAIKSAHVLETVDELEAALSVVSGKSDIYRLRSGIPTPPGPPRWPTRSPASRPPTTRTWPAATPSPSRPPSTRIGPTSTSD